MRQRNDHKRPSTMNNVQKLNNAPAWLIGGFLGLGICVVSVLIISVFGYLGEVGVVDSLPNGAGGFLVPFFLITIFPAALFPQTYIGLSVVLPINFAFYFLMGSAIAVIVKHIKKSS